MVLLREWLAFKSSSNHKAWKRFDWEVAWVESQGRKEIGVAANEADAAEPEVLRIDGATLWK